MHCESLICQPDLLQLVASGHVEAATCVGEDEARDANVVVAPHCCHLHHQDQDHRYHNEEQHGRYLHLTLQIRQGVG